VTKHAIRPIPPPVTRALVFVCERCGKRAGDSRRLSYELASHVKKKARHRWGKGEVRVALTTCMDACPERGISVSVQALSGPHAPVLVEADVHDIEAASDALVRLLRTMTDPVR
jgi:predicted metal-binding protein